MAKRAPGKRERAPVCFLPACDDVARSKRSRPSRDIIREQDIEYEAALLEDLRRAHQGQKNEEQGQRHSFATPESSASCEREATNTRTLPTERRARAALFARAFVQGVDPSIPARS